MSGNFSAFSLNFPAVRCFFANFQFFIFMYTYRKIFILEMRYENRNLYH